MTFAACHMSKRIINLWAQELFLKQGSQTTRDPGKCHNWKKDVTAIIPHTTILKLLSLGGLIFGPKLTLHCMYKQYSRISTKANETDYPKMTTRSTMSNICSKWLAFLLLQSPLFKTCQKIAGSNFARDFNRFL